MFSRKHFLVFAAGIALAGVLVYAPEALAQDQTQQRFDGILDQFRDQSIRWQGVLTMSARWLFFTLAIIQFAWTNMSLALKGGDISDFISHNTKQVLGIGIMYAFLVHAFAWSTALVMGFRQAGERAVIASAGAGAESTIDPAGIFQNGMIVAGSLFAQMSIWSGADNIALVICALVMIVCFAFLAAFMAVAIVESYIIIGGAVLFLGFGGSAWTADIAKKAMMYAVSVGAKLFVMQLIVGVAMGSVITWAQTYENDSSTSTLSLIGLIILITIMAKMIPELVQGILSGVSVGGTSAMVATIAAATAAAATGAAAAVGGGAAVAGGAGAGAAGGGGAATGAAGAATTGAQGAAMYGNASGGAFSEAAGHAARTAASDASAGTGQPLGPLGAVGRASDAHTGASSAPAGSGPSSTPYANTTASSPDGGSIRGAGEAPGDPAASPSGAGGATADVGAAAPASGASGAAPAASPGPVPAGPRVSSSLATTSAPGPLQSVSSESASPKDAPASSSGPGGSPTSLDERSGASSSSSAGAGGSSAPHGSSAGGITLDDAAPTSTPAGTSAQGGEPSSINERAAGPSAVDAEDSTPALAQPSAIDAEDSTPDRSAFSSASANLGKMAGHIVDTGSGLNPNAAVAPIAQLGDGGTDDDPDKPRPPSGVGGVRTTGEGLSDSASSSGGTIRGAGESVAQAATDLGRAVDSASGAGSSDSASRLRNAQRGAALGFIAAGPGGAAIGAAAGAALSPQIDATARRASAALAAAKSKFGLTPDKTNKPS